MNPVTTSWKGPSRADVERWCLLSAIASGCSLADLTARLGLSPLLAEAVRAAVLDLRRSGYVDELDERVSVTSAGENWQREFALQNDLG